MVRPRDSAPPSEHRLYADYLEEKIAILEHALILSRSRVEHERARAEAAERGAAIAWHVSLSGRPPIITGNGIVRSLPVARE